MNFDIAVKMVEGLAVVSLSIALFTYFIQARFKKKKRKYLMDDKSERKTIDRLKGLQVVFRVYTCIKSKLVDEEYS